jgi:hypothetical protein
MPIINNRQTLLDIATEYLGDPDRAVEIAILNNLDVDDIVAGSVIVLPTVDLNKSTVINGLGSRNLVPASAIEINIYEDEWILYYTTGLPVSPEA